MGNDNKTLLHHDSIAELTKQSSNFIKNHQFHHFYQWVLQRVFLQKRMSKSIIQVVTSLPSQPQQQRFLHEVHEANIQLLDSFYQHLYLSKLNYQPPPPNLNLCGEQPTEKGWELVSDKEAQIVHMTNSTHHIENYEELKELGLDLIAKKQVAFILLAGGKNLRFGSHTFKECEKLNIPSESSLIEIIFKRLQCLGCLVECEINLFILISGKEKKQKYKAIKSNLKTKYLKITQIEQIAYGCVDICGRLVVNDRSHVFMHPNGTGDIWGIFQSQPHCIQSYKYIQVFGLSNGLQSCFDCYMIGKVAKCSLPWATLAVEDFFMENQDPVIFVNKEGQIHVSDPLQADYPSNCPYIFANNTVISMKYIQKVIQHKDWPQCKQYRCKVHYFPSIKKKRLDLSLPNSFQDNNQLNGYDKILVFEKCYSDIFKMSKIMNNEKGCLIMVKKDQNFSHLVWKNDIKKCSIARSRQHKNWLGLDHKEELQICEIDPYLSLSGQNLEKIKEQLTQSQILYPLHLFPEEEENEEMMVKEEEDFDDIVL